MNDNRLQHLSDAFNSIISMMLAEIRARGLRSLIDLPAMIMAALYLRRLGRAFTALIASIDLSALPPPAPDIAPSDTAPLCASPPVREAAPAQPRPASRAGQRQSARRAAPHEGATPRPIPSTPATAARRSRIPHAIRHPAIPQPHRTPDPRAVASLPGTTRRS